MLCLFIALAICMPEVFPHLFSTAILLVCYEQYSAPLHHCHVVWGRSVRPGVYCSDLNASQAFKMEMPLLKSMSAQAETVNQIRPRRPLLVQSDIVNLSL